MEILNLLIITAPLALVWGILSIKDASECPERKKRHGSRCYNLDLEEGERRLLIELRNQLSYKDYYIFNNIILPLIGGGSSQLDHLVVSKYGIFVLENKDMKGWLFGRVSDAKWTQYLTDNHKYPFRNPLRQNFGHIKALQELIGGMDDKYFSIIAFSERSDFKTHFPDNVMHYKDVSKYIKNHDREIIMKDNLDKVLGRIFSLCQTVDITNEEHIEYLRNKFEN